MDEYDDIFQRLMALGEFDIAHDVMRAKQSREILEIEKEEDGHSGDTEVVSGSDSGL